MQGTIVDFKTDKRDIIADAEGAMKLLHGFLFDRLHVYLRKMAAANLNAAFASDGLSGIVKELLYCLDDASNYAVNTSDLVKDSYRQNRLTDFTGSTADKVPS